MDKSRLLDIINEVENLGYEFSNKSFVCGTHADEESTLEMRNIGAEFSNAISILREIILTEGV